MFDNVGRKLQVIGKVVCWIGIIASVIYGFILMQASTIAGLLAMALGSFTSWLSSLTTVAIGETLERVEAVQQNQSRIFTKIKEIESMHQ